MQDNQDNNLLQEIEREIETNIEANNENVPTIEPPSIVAETEIMESMISNDTSFQEVPTNRIKRGQNPFCTIYLLTNQVNGKIYIGQTWLTFDNRMGKHGEKYNNSIYLYNALQHYGVSNFHYTTLETTTDQATADKLEDFYIEKYDSMNPEIGYNLKRGGYGGLHSEKTKAKISATLKEQFANFSPEEYATRTDHFIGWWEGKERGPQSEEQKEANSKFFIEWHANNPHPMQGKHHTEEAKAKVGDAHRGIKRSVESIQKQVNTMVDHELDLKIISAYQLGKKIKDIQKELNIGSNHRIYDALRRNNVPNRKGKIPEKDYIKKVISQ